MNDVIEFGDYARLPRRKSEEAGLLSETFLLEEGLDLLASYRSIADPKIRMSLKNLVENVAASRKRRGGGS